MSFPVLKIIWFHIIYKKTDRLVQRCLRVSFFKDTWERNLPERMKWPLTQPIISRHTWHPQNSVGLDRMNKNRTQPEIGRSDHFGDLHLESAQWKKSFWWFLSSFVFANASGTTVKDNASKHVKMLDFYQVTKVAVCIVVNVMLGNKTGNMSLWYTSCTLFSLGPSISFPPVPQA